MSHNVEGKKNNVYLGSYNTKEEAFKVYKKYKEKLLKKIATEEYEKHYITEQCYNSLMAYRVEITD